MGELSFLLFFSLLHSLSSTSSSSFHNCQGPDMNITCAQILELPLIQFLGVGLHKATYLTSFQNVSLVVRVASNEGMCSVSININLYSLFPDFIEMNSPFLFEFSFLHTFSAFFLTPSLYLTQTQRSTSFEGNRSSKTSLPNGRPFTGSGKNSPIHRCVTEKCRRYSERVTPRTLLRTWWKGC